MKTLGIIAAIIWLLRRPEFKQSFRASYNRTINNHPRTRKDPESIRIKGVDY